MRPTLKTIRVVVVSGLVIMTTAIAASPVRQSLWPLASRQLARWSVLPSSTTPTYTSQDRSTARFDVALPPPVNQQGLGELSGPSSSQSRATHTRPAAAAASPATLPFGTELEEATDANFDAPASSARSGWGFRSWRAPAGGGGATIGTGPSALRRLARQEERDLRQEQRAAVAAAAQSSNGNGRQPAPSTPAAPPPHDTAAIFTEHQTAMPGLSGAPADSSGGGPLALTPTSVSSTPEPSTLLLLGTGVALALNRVRSRLARSKA